MSASHYAHLKDKILKTIFYIVVLAVMYQYLPSIVDTSKVNFLPENISTEKYVPRNPDMLGYTIVKVIDGDTVDIKKDDVIQKVRLIGINTPESVDPRRGVECFGAEASDYMKSIASDREVYIELDDTQSKYDKYGRLLAYIYLTDGQMLNRKMIAGGYAHEYTYDKPYKYQKDFKDIEKFAKNNSRGLWSDTTCRGLK